MDALQHSNRRILFNLLPFHVAQHFLGQDGHNTRSNLELYHQSHRQKSSCSNNNHQSFLATNLIRRFRGTEARHRPATAGSIINRTPLSNNSNNSKLNRISARSEAVQRRRSPLGAIPSEEERNFDAHFEEWEEKFQLWKEENKHHLDKVIL